MGIQASCGLSFSLPCRAGPELNPEFCQKFCLSDCPSSRGSYYHTVRVCVSSVSNNVSRLDKVIVTYVNFLRLCRNARYWYFEVKYIYYFYICTYLVTLYTRWYFMFLVSEKYRWFGDAVFSRFFKIIADFVTLFLTSPSHSTSTDVRHVQHSKSTIIPLIVSLITIPIALWTQISCRFLFCTPRNGCCSDYCRIKIHLWHSDFSHSAAASLTITP